MTDRDRFRVARVSLSAVPERGGMTATLTVMWEDYRYSTFSASGATLHSAVAACMAQAREEGVE